MFIQQTAGGDLQKIVTVVVCSKETVVWAEELTFSNNIFKYTEPYISDMVEN